ncbi:MAG: 4-(cytidine 5'-diphospho)-2-C-methyl-D-erythritol kinase [Pseudomonadota bacterium]
MPGADGDQPSIAIAAPAKVNLYLHVTDRRDDGLHELDSLFVRVDAADRLSAEAADRLSLQVRGPFGEALPPRSLDDNLVLNAARLLAAEAGVNAGADLVLDKQLPVAAGIGGGSADAAATLRLLMELWSLEIDPTRLAALAARLGADVPPCLHHQPVLVSGIGDVVEPAPRLPSVWLVLVNPGVEVLTARVFAARAGDFSPAHPLSHEPRDAAELAHELGLRRNDLEGPATALAPVIAAVLNQLRERPEILLARMSGSGATCFGLAATATDAARAAAAIAETHPDWWVRAAALLHDSDANRLPIGRGNR